MDLAPMIARLVGKSSQNIQNLTGHRNLSRTPSSGGKESSEDGRVRNRGKMVQKRYHDQ